ncbi:hypothetical protein AAMO2058_000094400 [Amorphochlora amoebiformis]
MRPFPILKTQVTKRVKTPVGRDMPKFGGAPKCPRCLKSVYKAEEVLANGKKWHKACFVCAGCRKGLSSSNACDGKGEIWCRGCYGKNFGPKGYGFGGGAGILQMTDKVGSSVGTVKNTETGLSKNPRTTKAYLGTRQQVNENSRCNACGEVLKAGVRFCSSCGAKVAPNLTSGFKALSVGGLGEGKKKKTSYGSKKAPKSKFGGGDRCPRCSDRVYSAEKVLGAGSVWHKACFRCVSCGKGLSSNTLAENKGEIYCRACHSKSFGPKGFGYGQGAGALAYTQ